MSEARAVAIARAHVEAWSNHDFDAAQRSLATDVNVTAMTTNSALPDTNLTGVDNYMRGLEEFALGLVVGSARVTASTGDEHNALLMVTAQPLPGNPFGAGTLSQGRLYLIDDEGKIKVEQVIFFAARA